MNYDLFFQYLFVMAGVTYLVRAVPFVAFKGKVKNAFFQSFLYYVPYAVLGAMTFPSIFFSTGEIWSGISGTVVGIFFAYQKKGLLFVAVVASAAALVVKMIMG